MIEFGHEPLARLPFPSLVIGSLNDPYMSMPDLERHVRGWGSDLTTIGFAGHINIASGFGRWPEAYSFFNRLKGGRSDAHSKGTSAAHADRATVNAVDGGRLPVT
jgi:predicted alpha/beta hydrolase family esterase